MRDRKQSGLRRKLADSGGLTLIEMLCATLILTLLCVMLSTGLSMAAYDYRMLTAEAETELLVNTVVSSLTDRLRDSTLSVKEEAGMRTYRHSLGTVTVAAGGPEAGKTEPAEATVVIKADGSTEQKALLPDGAYGTVFNGNAALRRYEVTSVSVFVPVTDASGLESELLLNQPLAVGGGEAYPAGGGTVTYKIQLTVKDRVTGVSRSTPDGGVIVRCLNPVKEI